LLLFRDDVVLFSFCCKFSFCLVTVTFALAVFLVRILDGNLFAEKILPVHVVACRIRSLETVKTDETIALAYVIVVTYDVWLP
jgi:hypothetical protein